MEGERGKLCPVCKVDTIRTNGAYACPECGRILAFVRPPPKLGRVDDLTNDSAWKNYQNLTITKE